MTLDLDQYGDHRAPYIPTLADLQLQVFLGTVGPEQMSPPEQRLHHYHQTQQHDEGKVA